LTKNTVVKPSIRPDIRYPAKTVSGASLFILYLSASVQDPHAICRLDPDPKDVERAKMKDKTQPIGRLLCMKSF
jgi:hypothetical protein